MKEGEVLRYIKKQIVDTVSSSTDDEELINFLRASIKKLHGYVGYNIKQKLIEKYGDKGWVVSMDALMKPTLSKGRDIEEKNEVIYIIRNISWIVGPARREVHRFLLRDFERNLPSTTFSKELYSRRVPFLVNKYTQLFTPFPIGGKKMRPIQIYLTKNLYKSTSGDIKELKQFYQLEVKDRRLGNWTGDIKTSTPILIKTLKLEQAFYQLQETLEDIYFIANNNPTKADREKHAAILKYMVDDVIPVTISNKPTSILTMSKAERDAVKAEKEAQEEQEKSSEEGMSEGGGGGNGGEQPLFGTDGPNVFDDNSIPEEQPMVGEDPGAIPPSDESMDRNYHDDERPDLEEAAEKESGEIPSEDETRDPVEEDAQTEAAITTPVGNNNNTNSYNSKEYSISDLMNMDRQIEATRVYEEGERDVSPSII